MLSNRVSRSMGLLFISALVMAVESIALAVGCVLASRTIHSGLLRRIMHAPMSFFDTTPLGRIMNRFAKDMDVIDTNMPMFIRSWLFSVAPMVSNIIIVVYTLPIIAAFAVPLVFLYYGVQVHVHVPSICHSLSTQQILLD